MGKAARLKAGRRREASELRTSLEEVQPAYPVEHAAAHEAGHAVVHWALDLAFDYVSLDTSPPGVWPLAGTKKHIGQDWLIGAAGCIADYQSRSLTIPDSEILKLLLGSPDGRFALIDQSGKIALRPAREPAVMRGADLYRMSLIMTGLGTGYQWPTREIVSVWRSCETYVSVCRTAVNHVAAELLVSRRLICSEVSHITNSAMSGLSLPVVPYWFEDARQLTLRLEAEACESSSLSKPGPYVAFPHV
jgi:hypothetical protein